MRMRKGSRSDSGYDSNNRFLPTANLPLEDTDGCMDLLLTHGGIDHEREGGKTRGRSLTVCLVRPPF